MERQAKTNMINDLLILVNTYFSFFIYCCTPSILLKLRHWKPSSGAKQGRLARSACVCVTADRQIETHMRLRSRVWYILRTDRMDTMDGRSSSNIDRLSSISCISSENVRNRPILASSSTHTSTYTTAVVSSFVAYWDACSYNRPASLSACSDLVCCYVHYPWINKIIYTCDTIYCCERTNLAAPTVHMHLDRVRINTITATYTMQEMDSAKC